MPIMVNVGNSYKEVTAILDKNGNAIDTVYAQNGSPVYSAWNSMTLTGVPPLPFKAKGTPLTAWSIYGNRQQTGTPSPQNIIMPEFVGVRTGNLLRNEETRIIVENNGITFTRNPDGSITANGTATARAKYTYYGMAAWKYDYDTNYYLSGCPSGGGTSTYSILIDSNVMQFRDVGAGKNVNIPSGTGGTYNLEIRIENGVTVSNLIFKPMLNLGSTALPYEPFGWAEKITCAGQTVPVYLGQTQTVRRVRKLVLDGTESITMPVTSSFQLFGVIDWGSNICYCTHFAQLTWTDATAGTSNCIGLRSGGSGADRIRISFPAYTSVDDFKSYLAAQYAAGTPVTVWYVLATPETAIVNEPLCKIGDYADELHSTDAGVTIPTAKGQNTLTVAGDLPPSNVSITGLIRPAQT